MENTTVKIISENTKKRIATCNLSEIADYFLPHPTKTGDSGRHSPDSPDIYYFDVVAGYGPTVRYFFLVEDESEIWNRIAIAEIHKS